MATDLTAAPAQAPAPAADLGVDRAFLMSMARVPLIAVVWAAAAWLASAAVEQFGWHVRVPEGAVNVGPLVVLCFGMLLAAFIDGWAFKVPNWCTLSLVVSGWYIGLAHDLGSAAVPGGGGLLAAVGGTAVGFALLFPALFVGGMGQGDVKMTMGYGSWIFAFFGAEQGLYVLLWSFAIGAIVGGVFGVVMMAMRRQFYKNWANTVDIMVDLQTLAKEGPAKAAARANARRPSWVRLPYGVPLCAGFLMYLGYVFVLAR